MMIVDAQIHLWSKGTPSAHHRQTPFLHEEALAMMDAAGVDRAVVHPVMWDPDSNELAVEAARAHPDRFAIMGWMYLDQPAQRALLDTWKRRPGMKGLRFYFSDPQSLTWPEDGTSSRNSSRSRVVLPAPLGPVRKTKSPRSTRRLTSDSAGAPGP